MYKVYYIMHSCFLVELDDRYLLFDYFDKNAVPSADFSGGLPQLSIDKSLYVFASHNHKDHFTFDVLKWAKERDDIKYILSKDIKLGRMAMLRNGIDSTVKDKIAFVSPQKKYIVDDMTIETLRSNEAGVAFAINCCGKNIYHAGDHNWWNVEGRGELYGEQYGREYKRYLRPIMHRKFDLAFVVLDPRMGEEGYFLGLDYFVKNFECDNIFPMHMWEDYKWIERFKKRPDIANLKERIIDIDRDNMLFEIEE